MMESSLININSASSEELQTIHGIGPQLASRIIDFRNRFGPIVVKEQLVAVRGLTGKQIDRMVQVIDWSKSDSDASPRATSQLPAVVMSVLVVAVLLFLIYPMVELFFEVFTHWEDDILHWFTTAVNLLAILFTISTLSLILAWLLSIFYSASPVHVRLVRYASGAVATFLLLLVIVSLAGYWFLNTYADVTRYMMNLMVIVGSVLLLVYLQFGPQLLCLTRYQLNEPASVFFDYSLFPLALTIMATAFLEPSMSPVVDIFMLWVGILLITYGLTLSRSCSCYADLLREIFTWPNILQNDPAMAVNLSNTILSIDEARSQHGAFTATGWATITISSVILLHGLFELVNLVLNSFDVV